MISSISLQYHILSCRRLARTIFRSCVSRRRQHAKTYLQVMGQLPGSRMTPGHPFAHTGVDYAGPIILKVGKVRKPVHIKSYICVFASFSMRAVHLKLVSDQTSEAFLAALRRFVARRGRPQRIHSDHETNFICAKHQLKSLDKLWQAKAFHLTSLTTVLLLV